MLDFSNLPRFEEFKTRIIVEIPKWASDYGVATEEIIRQLYLADGWIRNNPKKAPKSDIMRYLNSWMSIADRKGSMRRSPEKLKPREPEHEPDLTYEEMVKIREKNMGML